MTERRVTNSRRRLAAAVFPLAAVVLSACMPLTAHAVRANWGVRGLHPLEKKGRHEEVAFFYRGALDFWTVVQQLWLDAVYDERVDEIYEQYPEIFGGDKGFRGARTEEHQDNPEECLFFFNREGAARNVEAGRFLQAQRSRLEDRVRIYLEDLMDPDYGFGGDFSFSRKAWILERTGLFWHASFRRELAGRYALQVLSRYYAAVADEMERSFRDSDGAQLYRQKAASWRSRGLDELHLANGDRILARLKGNDKTKRLERSEVVAVLNKALQHDEPDARRTAVRILSDLAEFQVLERAMQDAEVEIRKRAASVFADHMYLPGLALAYRDPAGEVSAVAESALKVDPKSIGAYVRAVRCLEDGLRDERTRGFAAQQLGRLSGLTSGDRELEWQNWAEEVTAGMRPGVLVEYFVGTDKNTPVISKVFETVDIGLKLQANFPKIWYDYWDKPEIFPADAKGPFRLRIKANLYIPVDGDYRFYVKTVVESRAKVSITAPGAGKQEVISPANDENLQYVMQVGMPTHRIDFSEHVPLEQGLVELEIDYSGKEVRNIREGAYDHISAMSGIQKAGIQLFWSSDKHLTELVPAEHLVH